MGVAVKVVVVNFPYVRKIVSAKAKFTNEREAILGCLIDNVYASHIKRNLLCKSYCLNSRELKFSVVG